MEHEKIMVFPFSGGSGGEGTKIKIIYIYSLLN